MMKHVEELMMRQRDARNPGHELGMFLMTHTNSLSYLIDHLEAYLEAAKADLDAERVMFHRLIGS